MGAVVRALCEGQCAAPRARIHTTPNHNTERMRATEGSLHARFFAARAGLRLPGRRTRSSSSACRASGSTLLEQILSSHSAVEGTTELPEIITMARDLRDAGRDGGHRRLRRRAGDAWSAAELRELGERYIERTRVHRKTDRPFFIDKMPNNFLHVGDDPRSPCRTRRSSTRAGIRMACCFSNFKQHYARGQRFSYDLADLGRYYRDYVDADGAFRRGPAGPDPPGLLRANGRGHRGRGAPPARLLRPAVRAACLRFFENERPVRTAVPSRSASRSTARRWTSGGTTKPGSTP